MAGVPGIALALATAGGIMIYFGINDVPPVAGLRELAQGRLPAGTPPTKTVGVISKPGGTAGTTGALALTGAGGHPLVSAALTRLGKGYSQRQRYGPDTYDCSGLVVASLADLGIRSPYPTTHTQARLGTVTPGPPQAGDLVLWPAQHVGIATSPTHMVHAPRTGRVVSVDPIRSSMLGKPLVIRLDLPAMRARWPSGGRRP